MDIENRDLGWKPRRLGRWRRGRDLNPGGQSPLDLESSAFPG